MLILHVTWYMYINDVTKNIIIWTEMCHADNDDDEDDDDTVIIMHC